MLHQHFRTNHTYVRVSGALNKSSIGYETFNFNAAAVAADIQVQRSSTLSFLCVILNGQHGPQLLGQLVKLLTREHLISWRTWSAANHQNANDSHLTPKNNDDTDGWEFVPGKRKRRNNDSEDDKKQEDNGPK
ncbi:hypothetical protein KQX54_003876 [Cotesia glomerata]|uniref:Uncharacterized protein n=1 Tax=Cotesia glomerata TaxID=32391 RepID=A0AAV7IVQ4_COTGL|nr:hypothetical protein KQX54_003876 [Cotesia glomerata]